MKNLLIFIIILNLGFIAICSVPFSSYSLPNERWAANEFTCDIPSPNSQQQYTRGECYKYQFGPWTSCTDWACTLRYINERMQ